MCLLPFAHARRLGSLRRRVATAVATLVAFGGGASAARAEDVVATTTPPRHSLDGGLLLALPAALQTGMSAGVSAGYLRALTAGGRVQAGLRASWSTATEYTLTDTVRDDDLRLRLCFGVQHLAGRGSFGLRLGLGATAVREAIAPSQGGRAGLGGSALESVHWYLMPAADLEAVVFLRVWHDFGMSLTGGPTLHLDDGAARWGWTSGLGVLWQH
jgi:hypothetical protein